MNVTLASLDLFWLVNQARLLQSRGWLKHYYTTRVRKHVEGIDSQRGTSCYPLHYALRLMQMQPHLVGGNHFYLLLCRAFDRWLNGKFSRETDLLVILSGAGLQSIRSAHQAGIQTVVECGSTHPNFQHEIVLAEFRRNGITAPLFPEAYRERVRREFAEADYIQIPSQFVGATMIQNGIPEEKLLYAPYGVDLDIFSARNPPTKAQPFRAICPSGINLRKGARVLMEAWRKLGWDDAELHWIGTPSRDTAHLFKDLPTTVRLHPWMNHEDLSALYRACDVFVLPSFEEGFARVMVEAAACGLPLIVTPNTGAADFFTPDSHEGWLVEAGSTESLCEALSAAQADRENTYNLGVKAAKRARYFSWEAYGNRVIENYERVWTPSGLRSAAAQRLKQL